MSKTYEMTTLVSGLNKERERAIYCGMVHASTLEGFTGYRFLEEADSTEDGEAYRRFAVEGFTISVDNFSTPA